MRRTTATNQARQVIGEEILRGVSAASDGPLAGGGDGGLVNLPGGGAMAPGGGDEGGGILPGHHTTVGG